MNIAKRLIFNRRGSGVSPLPDMVLNISLLDSTNTYEIREDLTDTTQVFTNAELTDGTAEAFVGVGNNGYIANITDTTSGLVVTQPVLASQPSVITNGVLNTEYFKPVLLFDGIDDFLRLDTFTLPQPFTFSFAGRYEDGAPIGSQGGSSNYNMNIGGSNQLVSYGGTALLSTNNQADKSNFDLFSCIVDGANSSIRFDGSEDISGNVGSGGLNGLYIGIESRFNNKYLEGSFTELKIFSGNKSDSILSIEKTVATKLYNLPSTADIFYGGGQSNFDRRVALTDGNTPAYLSDKVVDGITVFNGNGFSEWDISKVSDFGSSGGDGTSWIDGAPGRSTDLWGFSVVALKEISDSRGNIVLCQVSKGGTALSNEWNSPSGSLVNALRDRNDRMMLLLDNFTVTNSKKGMVWHQGERDAALGTEAQYEANWTDLIAEIRSFTGTPNLPILYGTLSTASAEYNATIETAQLNVASGDSNLYCRNNSALTLFDSAHFDGASSITFGQWVRETYLLNY